MTDSFALVAQGDSVLEIILGSESARFSPVLFVVAALIYKEAAEKKRLRSSQRFSPVQR